MMGARTKIDVHHFSVRKPYWSTFVKGLNPAKLREFKPWLFTAPVTSWMFTAPVTSRRRSDNCLSCWAKFRAAAGETSYCLPLRNNGCKFARLVGGSVEHGVREKVVPEMLLECEQSYHYFQPSSSQTSMRRNLWYVLCKQCVNFLQQNLHVLKLGQIKAVWLYANWHSLISLLTDNNIVKPHSNQQWIFLNLQSTSWHPRKISKKKKVNTSINWKAALRRIMRKVSSVYDVL